MFRSSSVIAIFYTGLVLAAGAWSQAAQAEEYYTYAKVKEVTPVYYDSSYNHHRKNKHHKNKRHYNRQQYGNHNQYNPVPTIAGAAIGGVVGRSVSGSSDKVLGTVIGATVGGVVGHHVGKGYQSHSNQYGSNRYHNNHYPHSHDELDRNHPHQAEQCHHYSHTNNGNGHNYHGNHHYQGNPSIKGYKVRYRYQKQDFYTFLPHHPGKRIKIKVNVTPAVSY